MRFFEIVLLISGVFLPFINTSKKRTINNLWLLIWSIGILMLHILFEGLRWQMFSIYIICIAICIVLLRGISFFKGKTYLKIIKGIFLVLFLGFGFLLANTLAVFKLPVPKGEYKVGATYFYIKSEQEETITIDPTDKRELMVKVWYPANIKDEKKEYYLDHGERKGFAAKYGIPSWLFNYLDQIDTHTYVKPAIANGKFPILIFSHGYQANATGYYALIEEVVSHGFVVLNINHTYESVGSLFPSGTIKLYDWEYNAKYNNKEMSQLIWTSMQQYKNAITEKEKEATVSYALKNYIAATITERWANDIQMVLNQIEHWNATTFLSNHIDITKIGVLGHSQGGAAVGQALEDNPKISAGINLDGTQWGKKLDSPFTKPFLYVSSDWPKEHPDFNAYAYKKGSLDDMYIAKIKGTGHSNFMDIPLMINSSMLNEAGTINPKKAIEITSKLITTFFNQYLNNADKNLMNTLANYPELLIEKKEK